MKKKRQYIKTYENDHGFKLELYHNEISFNVSLNGHTFKAFWEEEEAVVYFDNFVKEWSKE
jgi:hypothetical protein